MRAIKYTGFSVVFLLFSVANAQSFADLATVTGEQVTGTLDGVGLSYAAPSAPQPLFISENLNVGGIATIMWTPTPPAMTDVVFQVLGTGNVPNSHVLTFSSSVVDPVLHMFALDTNSTLDFTGAVPSYESGFGTQLVGNVLSVTTGATDVSSASLKFSGSFTTLTWSHTAGIQDNVFYTFSTSNAVPEPSSFVLVSLGVIGLIRRRR